MNRRDALQALLASLAASSGVLPHPARTQPRMLSVVSVSGNSKESIAPTLAIFREALKTPGYIEGRNISFDLSAGEFSRDRTRQLAIEAMATKSDIIFAQHGAVHAFADLAKTIPIVAIYSGDMVEAKLVKSLAGPGGNITGVQLLGFDLVGKRIEILKELVPSIKHLWGGAVSRPNHAFARPACRSVHPAAEAAAGVGLVQLCRCGGLVSYGPNLREAWRRAASHFDRVAKGAAPATLLIELPTIFELVLNLKTARALGVKVPGSVMLRADRVIE